MENKNPYVQFNLDELQGFGGEEFTTFDYTRYLNVIKKRKWWIVVITLLVTALWIAQDIYFFSPTYSTTAVVHFNRADKQSPVENFDNTKAEGRVEILKTKNFLATVVDSLHLNLTLKHPDEFRHKVFKEIEIAPEAPYGKFRIKKAGNQYQLFSVKKDRETDEEIVKLLFTDDLETDGTTLLQYQGLTLNFRNKILESAKKIEFTHSPVRSAVSSLKRNLRPELDESETILYIKNKHDDPYLCADITNTMARKFIRYISEFGHIHTDAVLISLTRQLQTAQKELEASEQRLKEFRAQNPYLYADQKGERTIKQATGMEDELLKVERDIAYLQGLIDKSNDSEDFDATNQVYLEILAFLDSRDVPGASLFSMQYFSVMNERQKLLDQLLPPQNLEVVKITEKINNLRPQVMNRATRFLTDLTNEKNRLLNELNADRRNLQTLPKTELKYQELKRDHQIKEKIVADILEKYNEAKIFQSTILPEATLIDEAEVPRVQKAGLNLKATIIGMILGLLIGIGVFVGREVFDNTIKTPREIKDHLKLPVLASVPWVDKEKLKADQQESSNGNGNGKFDPNLITRDYAPTLENEVFRRLRVKLTPADTDKQVTAVITSLNPNEGKSFISSNLAITFAQQKRLTLLIDGDLRRGVLHSSFGTKKNPGMTDFLVSNCTIDTENIAKIIQKTYIPNLFMISTGKPVPNPLEVLGSPRMEALFQFLRRNFSTIIIDSPPFGLVPDIFTFKRFLQEVILVTRFERTNLNHLKDALHDFAENDMSIKGVVFNASQEEHKRYGKYYKYSYYNY